MGWDAFFPFALPWAPSCPEQTVVHYLRQAAIAFFSRTRAWREDMPELVGDGITGTFPLAIDGEVDVVVLYAVRVGGESLPIEEAGSGRASTQADASVHTAFVSDRRLLTVSPVPADGQVIAVRAALKPSQTSLGIGDAQFDHFAQAIADGALAEILRMSKQAWFDPGEATRRKAAFDAAIDEANIEATHGGAQFHSRPPLRMSL